MQAALLTPGDLSGGFTTQPIGNGLGDNSLSGCPTLTTYPPGTLSSVGVLLMDGNNDAIGDTLQQMSPGAVTAAMNAYAALPNTCGTFTGNISGIALTFHTAALSFPSYGDRTVAVVVTFDLGAAGTQSEQIVVVQHEDTLIGVVSQGLPTSTSLTQTAVNAAYAKVLRRW